MTPEIEALRMIETQLCTINNYLRTLEPDDRCHLKDAIRELTAARGKIERHTSLRWQQEQEKNDP